MSVHDDLYKRYRKFDPNQGSFTLNLSNQSYIVVSGPRLESQLGETGLINRNLFDFLRHPNLVILNKHSFIFLLLQEPSPAEPFITPEEKNIFVKFFTKKPFKKGKKQLKYLLTHIKNQYAKYKDSHLHTYFSAILPVLQSSGYGKSRSLIELGKYLPLFYASLQQGEGFPVKSKIMCNFINHLDVLINSSYEPYFLNTASTLLYVFILRMMFIILSVRDSNNLNAFIIDDELFSAMPLELILNLPGRSHEEKIFEILVNGLDKFFLPREVVSFDAENPIPLPNELQSFGHIPTKNGALYTDNLEEAVFGMLKRSKRNDFPHNEFPSIFVIDEAQFLIYDAKTKSIKQWNLRDSKYKSTDEDLTRSRTAFHILRRMCRIYGGIWRNILFIVAGTSCKVTNIFVHSEKDPSSRSLQHTTKQIPVFVMAHSFDILSFICKNIRENMFANDIRMWNAFLTSEFRISEFYRFGRPLIWAYFNFATDERFNNEKLYSNANLLIEKASVDKILSKKFDLSDEFFTQIIDYSPELTFYLSKILGGVSRKQELSSEYKDIFFSIFNLSLGMNLLPTSISAENLVENNMMTLLSVEHSFNCVITSGCFLPEGPLNSVATYSLLNRTRYLLTVVQELKKYNLISIGHFGIMIAEFVLLSSAFTCIDPEFSKMRKIIFQPIDLEDFLLELSDGDEKVINDFFRLNPELVHSRLSFSYFQNFDPGKRSIDRPFDLMARCLFRGSATSLYPNYPGLDLMIPLVLSDGRMSLIGVQVKLTKSHPKYSEIYNSMKLPPHQNPDDRAICYIIMSPMSSDTFNTFLEGPALVFSGNNFPRDSVMYMVMKEAPVSRDALDELEKDGVHYFEEIIDISRESDPTAGLDLDDELAH